MSGMNRADRLTELKRLYIQRAYSDKELAEKLGTRRETIFRDRKDLEDEGYIFIQDISGRWKIDRNSLISEIKVNLHEALTLYLAARKASRQTRFHHPHAASAVEKLAVTLRQPMTKRLLKSADRVLKQEKDPERIKIIETIAQAWVEQRKVRIEYQPLGSDGFTRHTISPYLIEPSIWSDSIYAIALSDYNDKIMPFKMDRINTAFLSGEEFDIPETFDDEELLKHAWGIWYADKKSVTVRLRFVPDPKVIQRLKESKWHPLEKVIDTEDGGCIWSADVAEWREMLPWVRGWGADVEVLEPEGLKNNLKLEVQRLTQLYSIMDNPSKNIGNSVGERILLLWGKTQRGNPDPYEFHPALFHMLDVAFVAQYLLDNDAPPRFRNMLAHVLGASSETLVDWIPYLVALHDIGKVSLAFQKLNKGQKERLIGEGFLFTGDTQQEMPHSLISQIYIERMTEMAPKMLQAWSEAMGGHHGRFAHPDEVKKDRAILSNELTEWNSFREAIDKILRNTFLTQDLAKLPEPSNISIAIMAINGFTILCDWIGSDSRYFQIQLKMNLDDYVGESKKRAKQAVENTGLLTSSTSEAPTNVQSLFSDLIPLRSLQTMIDDIPAEFLSVPTLSIIEAPTGEGKTEAALALAHRIGQMTGVDDLYYALPTTATSNQMFGRLQEHLKNRLGLSSLVKLVHGQAYLVEDDLRAEFPASMIEPLENGEATHEESVESLSWFNSKKRALLAPFGVGTIDQAELAVLNVKHVGLRMAGLVGKVLIVDEVHAYDTYMTTIIERLLRWLSSMNTSVILLSATLPISRRKRLAEAYCKDVMLDEQLTSAYPNLLIVKNHLSDEKTVWIPDEEIKVWQPNRVIEIDSLNFGDDEEQVLSKAKWLINKIRNGGCACWITNTVKRSQNIFKALMKLQDEMSLEVELDLIHSQFPLTKRQNKEAELKDKYARTGEKRPKQGIVIGTQVLEQSLDLDFDLMVSDLAPIDLLLQRAGRLHRHERKNRPSEHDKPRLFVNFEIDLDGNLIRGNDRKIYDEYIIRKTHQILMERVTRNLSITLPADYRVLIETIYSDHSPTENDPLYDAWLDLQSKENVTGKKAKERLLPEPHPRDSFAKTAAMKIKFEEDENSAAWIVAQTRLGEETLNVIPIAREGDWAYLDDGIKVNVKTEADLDTQRKMLRRHLRISNRDAIEAIQLDAEKHGTILFKKSTLLKSYSPIWLLKGEVHLPQEKPDIHINLDPILGLVIEKEKKAHDTTR